MVVETDRGAILAKDVVVGTNGYTDGLVPSLRRRIIPIGSYIIATEPLPEELAAELSPKGRAFFDTKNFLFYWHVSEPTGGWSSAAGQASCRHRSTGPRRSCTRGCSRFTRSSPGYRVDYAWGGNVGFTFDRMPHVGRKDGVTYAMGCCGTGVALMTWLGTAVGGWLSGDAAPALSRAAVPARCRLRTRAGHGSCRSSASGSGSRTGWRAARGRRRRLVTDAPRRPTAPAGARLPVSRSSAPKIATACWSGTSGSAQRAGEPIEAYLVEPAVGRCAYRLAGRALRPLVRHRGPERQSDRVRRRGGRLGPARMTRPRCCRSSRSLAGRPDRLHRRPRAGDRRGQSTPALPRRSRRGGRRSIPPGSASSGTTSAAMHAALLLGTDRRPATYVLIAAVPRWGDWFLPFWPIDEDRIDYLRAECARSTRSSISASSTRRTCCCSTRRRDFFIAPMTGLELQAAHRAADVELKPYEAEHDMAAAESPGGSHGVSRGSRSGAD